MSPENSDAQRVRNILANIKKLAVEYYELTGRPLGVTGEVAEFVAAELLGLDLAPPRTADYDAIRETLSGPEYIQIKGRAYAENAGGGRRLGTIKLGAKCDAVLLVLLDNRTLEPRELWEASYANVSARLAMPGARGKLHVSEFKNIASKVWPHE